MFTCQVASLTKTPKCVPLMLTQTTQTAYIDGDQKSPTASLQGPIRMFPGNSYAMSSPHLEATYSGVLGYYKIYLGSEYADIIEVIYQGPKYVYVIKDLRVMYPLIKTIIFTYTLYTCWPETRPLRQSTVTILRLGNVPRFSVSCGCYGVGIPQIVYLSLTRSEHLAIFSDG